MYACTFFFALLSGLQPLGTICSLQSIWALRAMAQVVEPMRDGKMVDGKIALSTSLWDTSLEMPPRQDATEVDARDAGTPDQWIKRHPDMLRNTGAHPFNSEPPLKPLQEAGWITPPSLHVVRNHGAVPQLSWSEHKRVGHHRFHSGYLHLCRQPSQRTEHDQEDCRL